MPYRKRNGLRTNLDGWHPQPLCDGMKAGSHLSTKNTQQPPVVWIDFMGSLEPLETMGFVNYPQIPRFSCGFAKTLDDHHIENTGRRSGEKKIRQCGNASLVTICRHDVIMCNRLVRIVWWLYFIVSRSSMPQKKTHTEVRCQEQEKCEVKFGEISPTYTFRSIRYYDIYIYITYHIHIHHSNLVLQ